MTRIIVVALMTALTAACTGPSGTDGRVRDSSPRHVLEPTTPGIHVSGHVIVGVSTVK